MDILLLYIVRKMSSNLSNNTQQSGAVALGNTSGAVALGNTSGAVALGNTAEAHVSANPVSVHNWDNLALGLERAGSQGEAEYEYEYDEESEEDDCAVSTTYADGTFQGGHEHGFQGVGYGHEYDSDRFQGVHEYEEDGFEVVRYGHEYDSDRFQGEDEYGHYEGQYPSSSDCGDDY
jgi:hypothetical protein